MKQWMMKNTLLKSLGILLVLSIIVVGASMYLIYQNHLIGPAYLGIAALSIFIMRVAGVDKKSVYPDIMFGIIDNGILIFAAVLGGQFAGVAGAVLGGAAGNTLTDGAGGLIEGKIAAKLKRDHYEEDRNAFTTMIGKVIGCLIGAGIGLTLVWGFKLIYTGLFVG